MLVSLCYFQCSFNLQKLIKLIIKTCHFIGLQQVAHFTKMFILIKKLSSFRGYFGVAEWVFYALNVTGKWKNNN